MTQKYFLQCKDGVCKNITSVYNCQFNATYEETFNCKNRKNCIDMTGLFFCKVSIFYILFYLVKKVSLFSIFF